MSLQQINNHYELVERIGEGGMAVVYKGHNLLTGEIVAIKVLKSVAGPTNAELLARFEREAHLLRELNHPNIIKIIDIISENNTNYIVMQYAQGGSLYDLQVKEEILPLEKVLHICLELADALARAHHVGVVHRDIKPANVLMTETGVPMLSDFGVAYVESLERLTESGVTIGTLDYLSPEALNGEPSSVLMDIWAFGVLLFEMVSGQRPFTGKSITEVIRAIVIDPVPDMKALRADTPDRLVRLIEKMLERDPQRRISSMRKVGAELEEIIYGKLPADTTRFQTPSDPVGVDYRSLKYQPADAPTTTQNQADDLLPTAKLKEISASEGDRPLGTKRLVMLVSAVAIAGALVLVAGTLVAGSAVLNHTATTTPTTISAPASNTIEHSGGSFQISEPVVRVTGVAPGIDEVSNSYFSIEIPAEWNEGQRLLNLASNNMSNLIIEETEHSVNGKFELLQGRIIPRLGAQGIRGVAVLRQDWLLGTYTLEDVEQNILDHLEYIKVTSFENRRIVTPIGTILNFEVELPKVESPNMMFGISRVFVNYYLDEETDMLYQIVFFWNTTPITREEMEPILNSFRTK